MTRNQLNTPRFFVGIDIASKTFHATLAGGPHRVIAGPAEFDNRAEGFEQFAAWLAKANATADTAVACMEATGVYSEALCHFLHGCGFPVAVEDALRVKRAFKTSANKTDAADSSQIAEYAVRYLDELRLWHPSEEIVEQVKVLLAMREQLVQQKGAKKNALHVLKRKAVQTPAANRLAEEMASPRRWSLVSKNRSARSNRRSSA